MFINTCGSKQCVTQHKKVVQKKVWSNEKTRLKSSLSLKKHIEKEERIVRIVQKKNHIPKNFLENFLID
jgi:hypothetical protein